MIVCSKCKFITYIDPLFCPHIPNLHIGANVMVAFNCSQCGSVDSMIDLTQYISIKTILHDDFVASRSPFIQVLIIALILLWTWIITTVSSICTYSIWLYEYWLCSTEPLNLTTTCPLLHLLWSSERCHRALRRQIHFFNSALQSDKQFNLSELCVCLRVLWTIRICIRYSIGV